MTTPSDSLWNESLLLTNLERLVSNGITWPRAADPARLTSLGPLRDASVLLLFSAVNSLPEPSLLFVERASTLRSHPGQIAFPGGRRDPEDGSEVDTALREAQEETGLDSEHVEVIGSLAALSVDVSRHAVTPVVAMSMIPGDLRVMDPGECADVFRVPIRQLTDPDARRLVVARRGRNRFTGPGFILSDGRLVWGFTAMVVDSILDSAGWAQPWDHSRTFSLDLEA